MCDVCKSINMSKRLELTVQRYQHRCHEYDEPQYEDETVYVDICSECEQRILKDFNESRVVTDINKVSTKFIEQYVKL